MTTIRFTCNACGQRNSVGLDAGKCPGGCDPRALGFNYGAPLPECRDHHYQFAKAVADLVRHRDSQSARAKSWALDMAVREVRISCTEGEREAALRKLHSMSSTPAWPRVTEAQAHRAILTAYDAIHG